MGRSGGDDLIQHIDGLVQERCNSSALALELRLSCTNPSTCIDDETKACFGGFFFS